MASTGPASWLTSAGGVALALSLLAAASASILMAARTIRPHLGATRLRLRGGHKWRTNSPLPRGQVAAALSKDARLFARRGLPAWRTLDGVLFILPTIIGMSAAGVLATNQFGEGAAAGALLANAGLVMLAVGMSSESLSALLSSDSDGPTLRLLRWSPGSFVRYLSAKAGLGAGMLCIFGVVAVVCVAAVAGWRGASGDMALVAVAIAAAAESVCVVVGSAVRPTLFRHELGGAELEPSVRLAAGIVSAVAITILTPAVLAASYLPTVPWWVMVPAAPASVFLAGVLARSSARVIYRNLTKEDQ